MSPQFEYDFFRQLFSKVDAESAYSWGCTIVAAVDVVLRVEVSEDDLISKVNDLSSFLINDGSELFFLCFGAGSRLCLFGLILLRVHLIVDLEWSFRENFEQGLSIIVDIDNIAACWWKEVLFVVYLKV